MPGSGRRTLFGAMCGAVAATAKGGGAAVGNVKVPDSRLDWLAELYSPLKFTPATVEFALPLGSDRTALRQADALVHVVNCFDGGEPESYWRSLNDDLLLADMESLEKRVERARKSAKGDKKYAQEAETLERMLAHLADGNPARTFDSDVAELLTAKPTICVANVAESSLGESPRSFGGESAITVCAKLESDLQELEPEERRTFLDDLGIAETGLDALIRRSYEMLGLISFLTAGHDEVRAWTITAGTKAPKAAGKIHSDLERGFIRAEVVAFDDLQSCGNLKAAKDKGLLRVEGKDYIVRDGDVVNILFNV
jgi:GTP-binding protein YchF